MAATKTSATTSIDVADTLTFGGVHYTRSDSIHIPVDHSSSPMKIVILQRGWVMVGRWGREGDDCWLDDAQVIERWGTTKGLGELIDGPTKNTRLAPCGHVQFHVLGVIASISVDESKW